MNEWRIAGRTKHKGDTKPKKEALGLLKEEIEAQFERGEDGYWL